MSQRTRLLALMLALCLPLGCAAAQETPAPTPEQQLDALFKRYSTMGACVAILQNGEVTYTHCYGSTQKNGDAITPDTLFQVGSISKMVANIGLMQLLQREGIPLDSELGDVLGYPVRNPAFPDEPVTLRQLMTHTASLRDSKAYDNALVGDGLPLSELFGTRAKYTFLGGTKPGSKRYYANFGGGLIGSLIEKLSGQTLDSYMQENVFAPLGITAAYQPATLPLRLPMADIYHMPAGRVSKVMRDDPHRDTEPDAEQHYILTAGKLVISAPDLCKLLIALCDEGAYQGVSILTPDQAEQITTPQNNLGSEPCAARNGLFLNIVTDRQVEGRTLYGHGGKAYGMLCAAYFDPTDRTGVVMLTNGCNNRVQRDGVGMLGRRVLTLCYETLIDDTHTPESPFEVQ